ncbi:MAG: TRAP transporter small permease [Zetaproteobacteria bacterium]|nr:MAG: TRAP transporter small permease [Zetaproteobacteria bacterium]
MRSVLDQIVGGALALVMGSMTALVFASVVLRYILNSPVTWSEELASLLFAWLTFVGAYVGFRTHSHIRIDTVTLFLPAGVRSGIRRLVQAGVLLILGILIWQGVSLTTTTWSLEFPAMEISRGYLYLSLPVGASLMVVAILLSPRRDAAGRGKDAEREC